MFVLFDQGEILNSSPVCNKYVNSMELCILKVILTKTILNLSKTMNILAKMQRLMPVLT